MINEEDFGFVIIATENNVPLINSTVNSIKFRYNSDIICAIPKDFKNPDGIECKTCYGKNTITSLINSGFKNGHNKWNCLVVAGAFMRIGINKKYSNFMKSEKDILYPIVCNYDIFGNPVKIYSNFSECSLNGIFIHQKTFLEVGKFSENPLDISKTFWALQAHDKGCNFKGVLGVKIC